MPRVGETIGKIAAMPSALYAATAVAVGTNIWTVFTAPSSVVRGVSYVVAVVLVANVTLIAGRRQARRQFEELIAWAPVDVRWHEDDDGTLHAFVTQLSGDMRVIAVPEEAATEEEAYGFVVEALRRG